MARNKKRRPESKNRSAEEPVTAYDKIARLLGILATKDLQRREQVMLLQGVGFSIAEIAQMLRISRNNVQVISHYGRKKTRSKNKLNKGDA